MEQVLKYPGSKWRLAKWVVRQLPPHKTYLEPFFGSGAVLFNKPPAKLETINDLDENVVNLFRVIRDHGNELAEIVYYTPWARSEYNSICSPDDVLIKTGEPVEDARRFLVRLWQAFGSKTCYTTGWRNNVQGSLGASGIGVWKRVPERIIGCIDRLRNVQIECKPAVDVIRAYRYPEACIYADPPYVMSTRSSKMYAYEMSNQDHIELLEVLLAHPGPVLISGYANDLYDSALVGWGRVTKAAVAELGQVREEVLWINPKAGRLNHWLFSYENVMEG